MIRTLQSLIAPDADYPPRVQRMKWLSSVLDGTLYDNLEYSFGDERSPAGEYVPLSKRRPSVRYNLAKIIVNDSVSMLFSEGHFPRIQSSDPDTAAAVERVAKDARLNEVMAGAAMIGSTGSVAILFSVLGARVFFKPMPTTYLTPEWDAAAPDRLLSVTEKYKILGSVLASRGYEISDDDMNAQFWFQRVWDANAETWFLPWRVGADVGERPSQYATVAAWVDQLQKDNRPVAYSWDNPTVDNRLTVKHGLGFVPVSWVRNLPGGDDVDGACTFEGAIAGQIEIEYQLSQAGRGLKYSSDPLLMIKEPPGVGSGGGGQLIKGANALIVSKEGDAKLLEISGSATGAVIEYARALREMALEAVGGNRTNADKLSAAQSGRAMELMAQSLIFLADRLRVSYGEGALLDLLNMTVKAGQKYKLVDRHGRPIGAMDADAEISLKWPRWFHPTALDRSQDAQTLSVLRAAKLISQESGVSAIADDYDIEDVAEEVARIGAGDQAAMDKLAAISAAANAGGADDGVTLPVPGDDRAAA